MAVDKRPQHIALYVVATVDTDEGQKPLPDPAAKSDFSTIENGCRLR
jgi:hypothetical protein